MSTGLLLKKHALALIDQDKIDEAIGIFKALANLNSQDVESHFQLAHLLRYRGEDASALQIYQTLTKNPQSEVSARAGIALTYFYQEDFEKAWPAYEVRFDMQKMAQVTMTKNGEKTSLPRISPEDPLPEQVMIMAEQGLGDTIQFSRYIPQLSDKGVKVHMVAPQRLIKLLTTLDANVTFYPLEQSKPIPTRNWLSMLDLPRILKIKPENYAKPDQYLKADPQKIDHWRKIMDKKAKGARLKVGLIWQGNPDPSIDLNRSTSLESFKSLSELKDVALFSLQKGFGEEQVESISFRNRIISLENVDEGDDGFLDTAAILKNLDLLISIDSSTAHLAGAMGVKTALLLKKVGSDWRWLRREKTSIWYDNHILFRQEKSGDWIGLIKKVIDELLLPTKVLPKITSPSLFLEDNQNLALFKDFMTNQIEKIMHEESTCEEPKKLKILIEKRLAYQDIIR